MKDLILKALQQETRVSGEELARSLNISRTAVWKHINQLRRSGYQIGSSPRSGYYLIKRTDLLLPEEIGLDLDTKVMGKRIIHHTTVSSTQDVAAELASRGAVEGTTIVAEMQTRGRGRKGRKWVSVSDGGIYLSLILRPDLGPSQMLQIPLVAGVALVRGIERYMDLQPRIKWPNDIIIGNKKVGGILTEMNCEIDHINFVILGVGVNVNTPASILAGETGGSATSLSEEYGEHISRAKLVQSFLREFEFIYTEYMKSGFGPVKNEWQLLNNTIGSWVRANDGVREIEGEALDIDSGGFLLVKQENGEVSRVISGDISLSNRTS